MPTVTKSHLLYHTQLMRNQYMPPSLQPANAATINNLPQTKQCFPNNRNVSSFITKVGSSIYLTEKQLEYKREAALKQIENDAKEKLHSLVSSHYSDFYAKWKKAANDLENLIKNVTPETLNYVKKRAVAFQNVVLSVVSQLRRHMLAQN